MEKKLFIITHGEKEHTLYVAAQSMKRVTEVYDPKKIEQVSNKVMVIRDNVGADGHKIENNADAFIDEIKEYCGEQDRKDFRFNHNEKHGNFVLEYIKRMHRHIIDAECSARGNQSTFESKDEQIKKLKWVLEMAVASEEKLYENEDTKPGWFQEAKELI